MLSKIILILPLLSRISSGCASITQNGVPTFALNICSGIRMHGVDGYYQIVCDSSETQAVMSAHFTSDCSDEDDDMTVPYPISGGFDVNCEEKYDCSYAVYRWYNDTTNNCAHYTTTDYMDIPYVVDECAYDISIYGSRMYTCDYTAIYSHVEMGDTEQLCEDTDSTIYIEEGCDTETGQYEEIAACVTPPAVTTSNSMSAGAISGIVVAIVVVIAVIALIIFFLKKKNKLPSIKGYRVVGTTASKNIDPSYKKSDEGINIKHIQQIHDVPPPPPPVAETQMVNYKSTENESLMQQNKYAIIEWLKRYAEIPETDANKYADIFVNNGFDNTAALKEIVMDDLVEMGISKLGHRKVIIKAIQTEDCLLQPAGV